MIYQFDEKKCLNGEWDFRPQYGEIESSIPPDDGWLKNAYLVPSWFKQDNAIYKTQSDKYYTDKRVKRCEIPESIKGKIEYLFNTMDYPNEWNDLNAAWAKRVINISPVAGKRYFIVAEGTSPSATLFINGICAKNQKDPMLPMECDITEYLQSGDNEIAFLMEGYDLSPAGKRMWPSGNLSTREHIGLWQNVYLVEKNEIFLEDVTIVTSVRNKTLSLKYVIKNTTKLDKTVTLKPEVTEYPSNLLAFEIPQLKHKAPANSSSEVEVCVQWGKSKAMGCL